MAEQRDTLRADCANCFALCCVAPAFAASADFAIDKPAGRPCVNLLTDYRCGIHTELRARGFPGCTVFDCFGAGQQVAQVTFGGRDWRQAPETASRMFDVFAVMRRLHELLYYLAEALSLLPAKTIHDDLARAFDTTRRHTQADPDTILALDLDAHHQEVNPLLLRASELTRATHPKGTGRATAHRAGRKGSRRGGHGEPDFRGADLVGADLKSADLRGLSLRGAVLLGADLRNADLRGADVIGADFRAADLRGADLTDAIFLIQSQLDAARGDATTRIPPSLTRPGHWSPK